MLFIYHFRASLIMLLFSQFFKMEASQLKIKMSTIHTVGSRQAACNERALQNYTAEIQGKIAS